MAQALVRSWLQHEDGAGTLFGTVREAAFPLRFLRGVGIPPNQPLTLIRWYVLGTNQNQPAGMWPRASRGRETGLCPGPRCPRAGISEGGPHRMLARPGVVAHSVLSLARSLSNT